jgi:hypothetical protein
MKALRLLLLLLAGLPLFAQPVPSNGDVHLRSNGTETDSWWDYDFKVTYSFYVLGDVKKLTVNVYTCYPNTIAGAIIGNFIPFGWYASYGGDPLCQLTPGIPDVLDSFVDGLKQQLNNWAAGAPQQISISAVPIHSQHPNFATAQPVAPPSPSLIVLDGLNGNIQQIDLGSGNVLSQVTPPQTALGPLGIRPTPTLPSTEVWVANGATQVSVLNMTSQTVTTNVATPSIPSGATPVGIVFTNSGNIGIEAFRLSSPDASGNLGVLAIFDAASRVLSSTFPLKYGPAQIVIAPDGLTAYLLSTGGEITYYDVLSGTADLSASTFTPGMNNGYNGVSNVFIHPDGTRLFWAVGPYVESFDLTARKVTAQFDSGLPTTSAITFGMSQDGTLATMSNGQGMGVVQDVQYGVIQLTFTFPGPALMFLGN